MQKTAHRRFGFRTSIILVTLLAGVGLTRMLLPWTIKTLFQWQAPTLFGVDLRVEDIDLALLRGRLTLHNLQLAQPAGFSDSNLLEAGRISAAISYRDLLRRNIRLTLKSENLLVRLEHAPTGALNLSRLMTDEVSSRSTAVDNTAAFGFILQQAVFHKAVLQYKTPDGTTLALSNIVFIASALNFSADPGNERQKGTIRMQARVVQPDAPPAALRAVVRLELPPANDIPALDGHLVFEKLHPQILSGLVPQAAYNLAPAPLDGALTFSYTDNRWTANLQVTQDEEHRTLVKAEALTVNFNTGEFEAHNLRLAQPAGFGNEPLLDLPQLRMQWEPDAGTGLHIRALEAAGPVINLGRDQSGRFLWDLFTVDNRRPAAADNQPGGVYLLEKAAITNMTLSYRDAALSEEPLETHLEQLQIEAEDLCLAQGAAQQLRQKGRLEFSAAIPQPGYRPGSLKGILNLDYTAAAPGAAELDLTLKNFNPRRHDKLVPERIQNAVPEGGLNLQCRIRATGPAIEGSLQLTSAAGNPVVTIDAASCGWDHQVLTVEGFRLAQPAGFPPGDMLAVDRALLRMDDADQAPRAARLLFAEIDRPRVFIIKSKGGVYNFDHLRPPPERPPATAAVEAADAERPWRLAAAHLRGGSLNYAHHFPTGRPLQIQMTNINCAASNIVFGVIAPPDPGTFELSAEIVQQWQTAGFLGFFRRSLPSTGHLGLAGLIGRLDAPLPDLNLTGCLIGLELNTLAPLVPPGAAQAIGGEALDIQGRLAIATNILSARFTARTIAEHTLPLISLDGTPENPQIQISSLALGIAGRLGGILGNTAQDLTMAARGLAGTALQTTMQAGRNAWQTVETTGQGLASTLRGAAQADVPAMTRGMRKATFDSARGAMISIIDLGDGIIQGTAATKRAGVGARRKATWRDAIPERWTNRQRQMHEDLLSMPYPPAP